MSLKRRCKMCKRDIPNSRKTARSSMCQWCERVPERESFRREGKANDGEKHRELKAKAVDFLISMGCVEVKCEWRSKGDKPMLIYDVIGKCPQKNGNKTIVVECGGSQRVKAHRIINDDMTLYIWAYGESKPFLFKADMDICRCCGHKV